MTKIVRLKTADASVLADVNSLRRQLSTDAKNVTLTTLKKVLEHPDIEIWVAKEDGHIVGMVALFLMLKLSGLVSRTEHVVVDERYRGRGLGKALMNKLIERARARRARGIELTSNPSRTAANVMYQNLGFKKRDTNVYRLKL